MKTLLSRLRTPLLPRRLWPLLPLLLTLLLLPACAPGTDSADSNENARRGTASSSPHAHYSRQGLPPEAIATLALIQQGGPYPYRKDGTTFQNRERLLPQKPRGYYREFTVPTPGARDRGARRFVTGGDPPEVFYYTEDHYRSFRRIELAPH
ncbi:MAG: ribonuclease domain-containing protein [Rhodocyclaceae bacterium]|jgi:guanyl-specific ribonuclease Sa|nr:ribonuclease domain-containing protein [Rhodocyclaceae bacterium]